NTPTICRKCYIHPAVVETYLAGGLALGLSARRRRRAASFTGLQREETAVLKLLRAHLTRRNARDRLRVGSVARLSKGGSHGNPSRVHAVASPHRNRAATLPVAAGAR